MTQMMDGQTTAAEDRRIPLTLMVLALPIIASMVSRTLMNLIDFVMVTQLGTKAQASIMPAGMVLFCVLAAAMGIFTAVSTYVSQSLGRGNKADCSAYAWQGVYLSLTGGVLLLPMWWLMPVLFRWAGHEPVVQQMEVAYSQIGVLGMAPMMVVFALTNFYNGIHRPSVALIAALIANAFNIAGNYALIFGHWGFAPMGVAGAAWSTQTSGLVQALIMLAWMMFPWYRREFHTLKTWRPNFARMGKILWIGAPAGFQFATDIVSFTIFTVALVGQFGTVQLAAHNLAFKFLEMSFMPTVGLGAAVTASVGKAIGSGNPERAKRIVRWGTLFGMSYMGMIAVGYVVLYFLVHAYGPSSFHSWLSDDNEVILWASRLLLFCAVFQLFDAVTIIHVSALRGAGDNHVPALISTTLALTVFLPGGYLMAHYLPQWQIAGPWTAATVYICLLGVMFWSRWHFGPWEKIKLHDESIEMAVATSESVPLP